MSAQTNYERLLPEIISIPKEKIRVPNYPPEELLAEAEKTKIISKEDKKLLVNAGLDPKVVDTFGDRIDVYTIASAKYIVLMDDSSKLEQQYHDLIEEAQNAKRELIHCFKFAYRDNKDALESLERITKGRSRKDMIFDFVSLIELANEYAEDLLKINFNSSLLLKAQNLHDKLKKIYAKIEVGPKQISEVKDIKNRAYTYLMEALQSIKEYGQFVFWKDEERCSLYKRHYLSSRKGNKTDVIQTDTDHEDNINEEAA